jgi:uncharacterized membrane protein YdfJ with MMPL/SSD domain
VNEEESHNEGRYSLLGDVLEQALPSPKLDHSVEGSWWVKVTGLTQHPVGSIAVLISVLALVVPLGMHAFDLTVGGGMDMYLPRGSAATLALDQLAHKFSPGAAYPYSLVIDVGDGRYGSSALSDLFVNEVGNMLQNFTSPGESAFPPHTKLVSYMFANGQLLSSKDINASLAGMIPWPIGSLVRSQVHKFLSQDRRSAIIQIMLGVIPFNSEGRDWLRQFRVRLDKESTARGLSVGLSGFGADLADSLEFVYYKFPMMISIITAVVLIVVGITFRSVTNALRGCVTIGLTVLFVSGCAKLVYCDGVLDVLGIPSLTGSSMNWLVPPAVFPILVGITLDYDIFLITSVVEFRDKGFSNRDAIVFGVSSSGTIITVAGVIQALAFFGLLMSSEEVLNQLSFYLFTGVLFDTFVCRTLVVPSIMYWLGEANWWPC